MGNLIWVIVAIVVIGVVIWLLTKGKKGPEMPEGPPPSSGTPGMQ